MPLFYFKPEAMKVLVSGTRVKTVIGGMEAIITGACIRETLLEYQIVYFYHGQRHSEWVHPYEIEVSAPKRTAGFNANNQTPIADSEVLLIPTTE